MKPFQDSNGNQKWWVVNQLELRGYLQISQKKSILTSKYFTA